MFDHRKSNLFIAVVLTIAGLSCTGDAAQKMVNYQADVGPEVYINTVQQLTDVIIHDQFSPPVASRIYAYPCIAAYEVLFCEDDSKPSFARRLNGLKEVPQPGDALINYQVAALTAFLEVARQLILSSDMLTTYEKEMRDKFNVAGVTASIQVSSIEYGKKVGQHIHEWADKDNYKESRSYPKYNAINEPGIWKPTPPANKEAIEPHWGSIRPMLIDSAGQFQSDLPGAFNMDGEIDYYQLVKEIFDIIKDADEEQKSIAGFWDRNPYLMDQRGDFKETVEAYALVSIALFDAFVLRN